MAKLKLNKLNITEKIKNVFLRRKCVKKILSYGDEKFEVLVIKDTFAGTRPLVKEIIVTNMFFNEFNTDEQKAILYHEKYHQKTTILKYTYYLISNYFNFIKANWQEEFDADMYARKKVGKKTTLLFLRKIKELYKEGKVAYDKKTHPSIEERIKRIEES